MKDGFIELLQVALRQRECLNCIPSEEEWNTLFKEAQKQGLVGVVFEGVKYLGEQGIKPPFAVLMQWIAESEIIKLQNKRSNQVAVKVSRLFEENGFRSCVLKGQGNALMYEAYPQPLPKGKGDGKSEGRDNLGMYRQPGDIDVWVMPEDVVNGS